MRLLQFQEPVGEEIAESERSTSKSSVSRAFVFREALWHLTGRQLAGLRLAVIMLDGIELHGRMNIVVLGISTEGDKLALGLWDGSTENATVAAALLSDLVDRGLDVEQGMLFVLDGSKALRKAVRQVFGNDVPVQRCVAHKQRNVLDLSPNATARESSPGCAGRGRTPTMTARWINSPDSPRSSTTLTPAPPPHCGKGWPRR